jgi:hypothetical protein
MKMTDMGLKEFAAVHKELRSLCLNETEVTDEGLRSLAVLRELSLNLLKCARVTDEGVGELERSLPMCFISR